MVPHNLTFNQSSFHLICQFVQTVIESIERDVFACTNLCMRDCCAEWAKRSLFGRLPQEASVEDLRQCGHQVSLLHLKKQSIASKSAVSLNGSDTENVAEPRPAVAEAALLVVLEKFFEVVLNLPKINRRLLDVMSLLSVEQPKCPQLYIYSSADKVIPAKSVESFIEEQRKSGIEVRACDFVSTPHVDHYRNDPTLYTSQLTNFLEDCVLTCCKHSS
ncbi:hypothetical protein MKW94_004200 [Papaver nudicaule]|uniref:Uncharacterized protein n=1 Tax=Papaver nudicaule TaxID=74823 RepID=A0AA41SAI5_PAPNU|nr:hypothetical protein [Papaver nudicaule]